METTWGSKLNAQNWGGGNSYKSHLKGSLMEG